MDGFDFTEAHLQEAAKVVAKLDEWRASGQPVPEYEIIAQAIADAEKRGKPALN